MDPSKVTDGESLKEARVSTIQRKSKRLQQAEYINLVFNIQLLMDKIVKYSVHKSNGKKIDQQTTANIRLVNKAWLQCVSRIIKASDYPAILLQAGSPFPNFHKRVIKTENNLEQFALDFCKTSHLPDSILPTGLLIEQNYLINRNRNNLRILFEQCSDLISTLCVNFHIVKQYQECVPIECTTFSFPILKQFKFQFETYRNMPRNSCWASCANGVNFLNLVLQNSKKLEHFSLINVRDIPVNVGFIELPETLKSVTLSPLLTEMEFELLMRNNLPNLIHLNLTIGEQDGVTRLRKILERFEHQLTDLQLTVNKVDDDEEGEEERYLPIFIDYPLLKRLQFLSLSGQDFDLLPRFRENWPKMVPNLTRLDFEDIEVKEESIVLNWIQGLRFENVRKFKFLPSYIDNDTEVVESPSEQMISEIITSFPNIQKLTLKFRFCETSGLKYLFQNFTHLEELHLNFEFDELDGSTGCKVVSLFLGITLELATTLVNDTKNTVNVPSDNRESIMNLKELHSLTLWTELYGCRGFSNNSLCSEVFSRHGLEKMPKLRNIKLLGGFQIEQ